MGMSECGDRQRIVDFERLPTPMKPSSPKVLHEYQGQETVLESDEAFYVTAPLSIT